MKTKRRSRKKDYSGLIFLLIFCLIFAVGLFFALQKPTPIYADSLSFPVGEDLTLSDVVIDVKGGSLMDSHRIINSSEEGEVRIPFEMENIFHRKTEADILIEFHKEEEKKTETVPETKAPEETRNDPVKISSPEVIYVPLGEKPDFSSCTAANSAGETFPVTPSQNYDTAKEGEYKVTLTATDKNGKKVTKDIKIIVIHSPFGAEGSLIDGTYKTQNGKTLVVKNGLATVDGTLIVNKSYSLPKTYSVGALTRETEAAFQEMKEAAQKEGHALTIRSAYRTRERQEYLFNNYVKNDGLEDALTYSARPGHSEHQTGLAMDINTASTVESRNPEMKVILDWLSANASKYGFILRYPEGKSDITGYIFEPWHFRYVGKDMAEKLYQNGEWITLEEYFGVDSIYRGY